MQITWQNLETAVNVEKKAVYLRDGKEYKYKVLGVLNDCVFISFRERKDEKDWERSAGGWWHIQELVQDGYVIEQPEQEPWKPKEGEHYYTVYPGGEVSWLRWDGNSHNNYRLSIGNVFPHTEEGKKQAEQYRDELIAWAKGRKK